MLASLMQWSDIRAKNKLTRVHHLRFQSEKKKYWWHNFFEGDKKKEIHKKYFNPTQLIV